MQQEDPYKNFNKATKTFMKELISTYPDMTELKTLLVFFKMLKSVSKKSPQKLFVQLLSDHYDDLLAKRWDYFLSDQFTYEPVKDVLERLKVVFRAMDDANRDIIWQHMVVLIGLSNRCVAKN